MGVQSLDKRVSFGMFIKGMKEKFQGILNKSLTPEEKLNLIQNEMEKDVEKKRVTARSIRTKMVALSDPDTATLEPLERIKVKREKLVKVGAILLEEKAKAVAEGNPDLANQKDKQLNKIAQEVKIITSQIKSMETTYDTLKEAYEVALENYKTASAAFEHIKNNGSGLLFAIKAHQEALTIRDNTRKGDAIDSSFLTDLEQDLSKAQGELRSDKHIEEEVNKDSVSSIVEETEGVEDIMEEFKRAKK